jgi:TRAP-type transport system periplasmic protein
LKNAAPGPKVEASPGHPRHVCHMGGHVMKVSYSRRAFTRLAAAGLAAPALLRTAWADDVLKLRCSLDTAPSHPRNQAVVDFLNKVDEATKGRIKSEVFHSGQLFADLNVSKALIQGQIDMAAPGVWTMTGLVPDCDFGQLPQLYGQPIEVMHRAMDGGAGALVARQLEAKIKSHILGKWIDLGYQNWYLTSKAVRSLDDLKGLKVRSPGGAGISWRISFAGAIPNVTPWPNVPLALSQGTFDGLVSTDESCNTAKLWEAGIKYSYADHQFMGCYVPMLSESFWAKLDEAQRKTMTDIWAANIDGYRANAARLQAGGRQAMESHGVSFVDPTPEHLAADRKRMIADQDRLIKDAKLSAEIVKLVSEAVGAAG